MAESQWLPPADVTRHAGGTIPPEMEFFVAPSPEIGKIISADSSLTTAMKPMDASKKWMFILLGTFVAGSFFQSLIVVLGLTVAGFWQIAVIIVALSVGVLIHAKTSFSHQCSYVGDRGIETHRFFGDRLGKKVTKSLKFAEAVDLYTAQTQMYTNGIYTGTTYSYKWTKTDGKKFLLAGQYHNKKGWPAENHPWHLANTGEAEWSNYRLQFLNLELEKTGYIEFAMSGNPKAVRVGNGFMEFVLKDNSVQRVAINDMKDISLGEGYFKFAHNDARWWSGKGKFSFSYANLPNAKLFLFCLDRLAGIRWS